jgi:hypothetical protein
LAWRLHHCWSVHGGGWIMKKLFLLLAVALMLSACGADAGDPGDPDGTCYDCRTVCEGCFGEFLDACLAKCVECQRYSDCFAWMEGRYEGMNQSMCDWTFVNCDDLN